MRWAAAERLKQRIAIAGLAIAALLLQVAVPQGFMVARAATGPAIVICTGHGPMMATVDEHGMPSKMPGGKSAPMCPFAGHGGTPTVAAAPCLTSVRFERYIERPLAFAAVSPGRGLAAPPPPSRAPPALPI